MRVSDVSETIDSEQTNLSPKPSACAKVSLNLSLIRLFIHQFITNCFMPSKQDNNAWTMYPGTSIWNQGADFYAAEYEFFPFQLRNFLESSLLELKESWMKRLTYYTCVECPCGRPCYLHGNDACKEEGCLHFLDLDECLANRVYIYILTSYGLVLVSNWQNILNTNQIYEVTTIKMKLK